MPDVHNMRLAHARQMWEEETGKSVDWTLKPLRQGNYLEWLNYIKFPLDTEMNDDSTYTVPQECAEMIEMLTGPNRKILMKIKAIRDAHVEDGENRIRTGAQSVG